MAIRHRLSDDDGTSIADAIPHKPAVRRYPCFAEGCPMPGTIFLGAGLGGTGETRGTCAWHYGVAPHDIPKVTQVFKDWAFLAYEIDVCRRAHTASETACNPKALDDLMAGAIERLRPIVAGAGWGEEFEPAAGEHYREWGKRMERFIGGRVVAVLSTYGQRRSA